ncbi:MAG TPA: penicillin-binding transpeptidase domain-containing protein, partial [Patescibacteria group bacterium]
TPISERTAKVMSEIMVNAVDKGEAKWAKPKGYRIAGKTGTAQIPVAGHYDPTKTIASFIGFAPAEDPKFLMLVIINRPKTSIYGAETAAPVFFNVAKKILTYYGIAPSE